MRKFFTLCMLVFSGFLSVFAQENPDPDTTKAAQTIELPSISLSSSDLEEAEIGGDNISGLLYSSKDIYVSTAGYQFGATRYRVRGLNSEMTSVALNGIPMNDVESGRAYWSTWGGLNDATRSQIYQNGVGFTQDEFGNVGGLTNITTRASQYRPGTRLTYSATNRSYRNRVMATFASGLMDNGWALAVSASRRWAEEGYVEGTFYDAYSYFLSVEKQINKHHSLNFTGLGAPRKYGKSSPSTQEAYDLAGSNYYNPNWGYQNGEKRNARVNDYHKPFFALTHNWQITDNSTLKSSVSYGFGKGGGTALNWYTGNDPRPDYYKNLPSYWKTTKNDAIEYQRVYGSWVSDESTRQLDWDRFYLMNENNQETILNADNTEGNTVSGKRSVNIIEERRNDHSQFNFNTVYNQRLDNIAFNAGLNATIYKGYHFKVVSDLLGGDFWLDENKYIEREEVAAEGALLPDAAQNDLNNLNNVVYEGERFGYDYTANVNKVAAFGQAKYISNMLEAFAGLRLSQTAFWRTGNMKNGAHPDNSFGDGEKASFFDYALKAGLTYKITGRHFIQANASFQTMAPYFRNAYYASRTRDGIIDGIESNKIFTTDLSYIVKMTKFKGRATVFYNTNNDQTLVQNLFVETIDQTGNQGDLVTIEGGFGSYIWKGVDTKSYGAELGIDADITSALRFTAAGGIGNYYYNSRPDISFSLDKQEGVTERGIAYLKNYKIGGFPQTAASVGLQYSGKQYWRVGVNVNYFDDIYISLTPEKHLDENLVGYTFDHPQTAQILEQEKLDANFTVDLFAMKSWRIHGYYIQLSLNMSNLLDNNDLAFGGYEQFRFDRESPDRFQNKYFYLYGRQYYLNLSFSF